MEDAVIVCPYNEAHEVGVARIQQHLIKCRKQNPDKAKVISICPYNQSHHLPSANMPAHLKVCRDFQAHKFHQLKQVERPEPFVNIPKSESARSTTEAGSSGSASGMCNLVKNLNDDDDNYWVQ